MTAEVLPNMVHADPARWLGPPYERVSCIELRELWFGRRERNPYQLA